jgi:hypothetical protein
VFWFFGLDLFPAPGIAVPAPWSHGLTMACIWSVGAMAVVSLFTRNARTRLLFGVLVFSHCIVDFIAPPMGTAFPGAGFRMRVFFGESPTIEGLGLYNSAVVLNVIEYGTLVIGPRYTYPGAFVMRGGPTLSVANGNASAANYGSL